ncbi:hypothetical protein CBS63078_11150 [Aspergillus niger]|nr:hypothetical protein CBS13152_11220 [Aspergillus niger]KAI2869207.1 hypothetical protein CBS11852_11258 [Aspergillus niger]KAI2885612.1 hypothetical protein CBS63078_11150 [Aspergillus niger]KAI3014863.1 hypothetical protein CBS147347_11363 [Aspergillus niger]KAI3034940.1 hypothetical protein CBS76997_10904 [Aspergillus niger]
MERIVYSHAQQTPDASAVVADNTTLTYSELVSEAIQLAELLNAEGIKSLEEPMGILLGPGLGKVVAQLAPVHIRAESILHLATSTPVTPLLTSDRVAEFNNPGFDLSLFEIWATLLTGATIVAIPRRIATDPGAINLYVQEHQVSVIFITAALFRITVSACPSAFSTLRHVLMGGDVASVQAIRSVFEHGPPQHLWNTYGPTECTTLTTMHEVTRADTDSERIPIGRPPGQPGEVYIAGPQQAAGYFGRPAETATQFVRIPRPGCHSENPSIVRVYRTGDKAQWRADSNILDFLGRTDSRVKHGGFRVELGEIERALESHPRVQTGSLDSRRADALIQFARELLPSYMIPEAVEVMKELPLTPNGKFDRATLVQRRIDTIQKQKHDVSAPSPQSDGDAQDKYAILRDIWMDILHLPQIHDGDDLFALGGTSMQAAEIIALVQNHLGVLISMEELYRHSRFDELVCRVQPADPLTHGNAPDDTHIWMQDVDLVNDIA